MKPLDMYKDAVMRRAEKKRHERRTARKRLLAVCIPLCLCIGIAAAAALPHMLPISSDGTAALHEGNRMPSASDSLFAAVSVNNGQSEQTVTDPAQLDTLYTAVKTLCELTDITVASGGDETSDYMDAPLYGVGIPEIAGDHTDGEDAEFAENSNQLGYRLCFYGAHENSVTDDAVYTLQGNLLTDCSSGETQLLTTDQLHELTSLLEEVLA